MSSKNAAPAATSVYNYEANTAPSIITLDEDVQQVVPLKSLLYLAHQGLCKVVMETNISCGHICQLI